MIDATLFGWGIKLCRSFSGGAIGVPISWRWCVQVHYRSPVLMVGSDKNLEVMVSTWPWIWATKYFYFGEEHPCYVGRQCSVSEISDYAKYIKYITGAL